MLIKMSGMMTRALRAHRAAADRSGALAETYRLEPAHGPGSTIVRRAYVFMMPSFAVFSVPSSGRRSYSGPEQTLRSKYTSTAVTCLRFFVGWIEYFDISRARRRQL